MIARITIALALLAMATVAKGQDSAATEVSQPNQERTSELQSENAAATATPSDHSTEPSTATKTDAPADTPTAKAQPADSTVADAPPTVAPPADLPMEADASKLHELLSLVQDNTLAVHKRENPAYFMLMKQVIDRTPEKLREEVALNPRFNDLYKKPSEYRGQLVHVKLNARRVLPVDIASRNVAGVTRLYEIWGWTEEAKAWMYCCVVPELPEGFPEEGDIAKRIELTGYFFKMQAYQPGNAAPNARNLVAPLIIGRIVDAGPIATKQSDSMGNWPLFLIIGFGIIVMFRVMLHLRGMGRTTPVRRNYRRRSLEPVDPDAMSDGLMADRGVRIRNANEA